MEEWKGECHVNTLTPKYLNQNEGLALVQVLLLF